jgi:hypothetical protein
MPIGIGARLPGPPPTPPSMRDRTRRFVARMQTSANALLDSTSPRRSSTRSIKPAGHLTSWRDAPFCQTSSGPCRSSRMRERHRGTCPRKSVSSVESSTSSTAFNNELALVASGFPNRSVRALVQVDERCLDVIQREVSHRDLRGQRGRPLMNSVFSVSSVAGILQSPSTLVTRPLGPRYRRRSSTKKVGRNDWVELH